MPAHKTNKTSKPAVAKTTRRSAAAGETDTTLPESMITGKASHAKAADGDQPVFACIASLPQPQRGIAERIDALAAKTLPGLLRSVKWGMSYSGVGDGWCFCCGGFATHVTLMFMNGVTLAPVPRVTPVAMGLFPLDTWRDVLRDTGFEVYEGRYTSGEDEYTVFACVKPE